MAQLLSSFSLPKQQKKEIDKMYMNEYMEYPTEYTKMAKVSDAEPGNRITEADISGLGLFQPLGEGEGVTFDVPAEGNEVTRRYIKIGLGFQVTEEAIQDELFGKIKKMSGTLGKRSAQSLDMYFFDLFNRGFSGGVHTAKDGQPIFSTAHTIIDDRTGVTGTSVLSNAASADLTETSLAAAMEYFNGLVDENGLPIVMRPKYLLHTESDTILAHRLHTQIYGGTVNPGGLGVNGDGFAANLNAVNGKNPLHPIAEGGWNPMLSRWLTDSDSWFFISDDHDFRMVFKQKAGLKSFDDPNTGNMMYHSKIRFSTFCNEWRGAYGSAGA